MKLVQAGAAVTLMVSTAAQAQTYVQWQTPASGQSTYFPMGTPVTLRTKTEVNTKRSKPGDRLSLEVAESISYRGQVIVPAGAPAMAEVVRSERNGHFGKKGKIEVRLLHVETPFGPVRLAGQASDDGKGARLWSIGGAVLVAWPLVFVHGTSGYLPHGTVIAGHLAEPLRFTSSPQEAAVPVAQVNADGRALPVSFDPSAFGMKAESGIARR